MSGHKITKWILALVCWVGAAEAGAEPPGSARLGAWGLDLQAMDRSVAPGQDFAAHAWGRWASETTPTPEEPVRSVIFDALARNGVVMTDIITGSSGGASVEAKQIASAYESFRDAEEVQRRGAEPIRAALRRIARADREDLARLAGGSPRSLHGSLVQPGVGADQADSTKQALYLSLGGLLLDAPRYAAEADAPVRASLTDYAADMLTLAGWNEAAARARAVVAFEAKAAALHWSIEDRRDRLKTYNPVTLAELQAFAPGFPWRAFLEGLGVSPQTRIVAMEKSALPAFARLYTETDLDVLRAWAAFRLADRAAPYLSAAFVDRRFDFQGRVLQGRSQPASRDTEAAAFVRAWLGGALGTEFARRTATPEAIEAVTVIAEDVRAAMRARLLETAWLDAQTREAALAKLAALRFRIGAAPGGMRRLDATLDPKDLYGNAERLLAANWAHRLEDLEGGAEEAWLVFPQVMSAANVLEQNTVYVPPALFQAPYLQMGGDPAVNYGAIGAVIGHEIVHAFDDQGRQFDGKGNLSDWWSAESATAFQIGAQKLVAHVDGLSFEGVPLSGSRALTETIADIGGVGLAAEAYIRRYGAQGPAIDGVSPLQRVFLGWAQLQRGEATVEAAREFVAYAPYLPGAMRAQEPMRHLELWYDAFDVESGAALFLPPDKRQRIW